MQHYGLARPCLEALSPLGLPSHSR